LYNSSINIGVTANKNMFSNNVQTLSFKTEIAEQLKKGRQFVFIKVPLGFTKHAKDRCNKQIILGISPI
jgi:hypothetical protein